MWNMNILVLNLSDNIISKDLVELFSVYGEVSYAAIVRDNKSGRSKGNAFLEMPHEAEGEQAILALNHQELDGREIIVQEIVYKPGEFNN
jgi:RNA recognition motif-containing protein